MPQDLYNMSYYESVIRFFSRPYAGSTADGNLEVIDLEKPLSYNLANKKRWSAYLGENGWVISPHIKIGRGIHPWYWAARRNRYDLIEGFFNNQIISRIRGYVRENLAVDKQSQFVEAESTYLSNQFTSCAMVLVSLFEGCIRECPIPAWRFRILPFYKEAIQDKLVVKDSLKNEYIGQLMLKNDVHTLYLPSLNPFITRLFIDGEYKMEDTNEPPYLNRNWLMHGMMKRDVTKTDCIQMFNAIFTLLYIKTYLVEGSPYDN